MSVQLDPKIASQIPPGNVAAKPSAKPAAAPKVAPGAAVMRSTPVQTPSAPETALAVRTIDLPATRPPLGFRFAEVMKGTAVIDGKEVKVRCDFKIHIPSLDGFEKDPDHGGKVTGTIRIDGGPPLPLEGGIFIMAPGEPKKGEARTNLRYHFETLPGIEPSYRFAGAKRVHDDPGPDVLTDSSFLEGNFLAPGVPMDGNQEATRAKAHLRFQWWNPFVVIPFFASFTTENARGIGDKIEGVKRFLSVFFNGIAREHF